MEALNSEQRAEVRARYSNLEFPDPVLEPVWFGRRPEKRVPETKAIINQNAKDDENEVFGICSDQYQIIHYEDIIRMVEKTVESLPEFGKIEVTPKIIQDGRKMKIEAWMRDTEYEIQKGDFVNPSIKIRTSYDLAWKLTGAFGALRLVCTNGMTVGKMFSKFARRHITSLDPAELTKSIQEGMTKYSDQVGLWKKWAETKLTKATYDAMWEALPFTPGEKEKIEKLPETGTKLLLPESVTKGDLTMWDFHSVVTQFVTHNIASEVRIADIEPKIVRAFEAKYN